MSLQAVIAASFAGIGVLVALYAERRVALPSLAELRANIWAADSHLAAQEGRPDGMLHRLRPLLDRAGLPRIRFHDLRHSAATLLMSRGIHPKVVSEMLGHSQITITMDLYSHVLPTMQREAAAVMEDILQG